MFFHPFFPSDHLSSFISIFLFLLTLYRPSWGCLGLLAGYAGGDRIFALCHICFLGIPLFVTELTLAAALIHLTFHERKQWMLKGLSWRNPWLWFAGVSLWSAVRGLIIYTPVLVARDAAMAYYAVISFIAWRLVKRPGHVYFIFFVFVGGLLIRFLLFKPTPFSSGLDGTSATAMYCSVLVFGAFCAYSQWRSWRILAYPILGFLIMSPVASCIRAAWVAFGVAFLVMAVLLWRSRCDTGCVWKLGLLSITSVMLLCGIYAKWNPNHLRDLRYRYETFFMGKDSPDVLTRVAMWEDSIQAVFPFAGRYFLMFDRKILNPWLFGKSESQAPIYEMPKPHRGVISGTSIIDNSQAKPVENLTGIPLAKVFFPDQISRINEALSLLPQSVDPFSSLQKVPSSIVHQKISPLNVSSAKASGSVESVSMAIIQDAKKAIAITSRAGSMASEMSNKSSKAAEMLIWMGNENQLLANMLWNAGNHARITGEFAREQAALLTGLIYQVNSTRIENAEDRKQLLAKLRFETSHSYQSALDAYQASKTVVSKLSEAYAVGAQDSGFRYEVARVDNNATIKFIFGVPFGKLFIPGRISFVHKADRYDPHNSFLAILYRTGLLGLFAFLAILWREMRRAYRYAIQTTSLISKELLLACMIGVVFHLANALGDVIFENAYKGGILWLLLGIMISLRTQNFLKSQVDSSDGK